LRKLDFYLKPKEIGDFGFVDVPDLKNQLSSRKKIIISSEDYD
jgi:hypothetical protein